MLELVRKWVDFFGENITLCIFIQNNLSEKNNYIALQVY